jgi:hypothetical protein
MARRLSKISADFAFRFTRKRDGAFCADEDEANTDADGSPDQIARHAGMNAD